LANPELGAKQICPNCQSKFYDLNRRPAHCPKCGEDFDPEEAIRTRRVRARSAAPDYEADEEKPVKPEPDADGFEDEVDDTPELDDAAVVEAPVDDEDAEVDPGAPAPAADDLGVDFAADEELEDDEADDVPFLEDEDEDDFPEDEIEGLPGEGDEDR
jgi:uncharacterized protein (TIGR02300 family)